MVVMPCRHLRSSSGRKHSIFIYQSWMQDLVLGWWLLVGLLVLMIYGSYRPKVHDWASRALEIVKIKSCLSGLNFYSAVFVRSPAFCKHQLYCKIPTDSVFVHLLLKACFSGMTWVIFSTTPMHSTPFQLFLSLQPLFSNDTYLDLRLLDIPKIVRIWFCSTNILCPNRKLGKCIYDKGAGRMFKK